MTDAFNTTYIINECEWPEGADLPEVVTFDLPDWFCLAKEYDHDEAEWDRQTNAALLAKFGHVPLSYGDFGPYDDHYEGDLQDYFDEQ